MIVIMKFLSEKANKLTPYVPGEQPQDCEYIKLNTNENPYKPSSKAIEAIKKFDFERLRLYPDPESTKLRETFAKKIGMKAENIFVGNGSDEVLATAFQTFFEDKENILMPDISYSFYPVYCKMYNIKSKEIPLLENYSINIDDYKIKNNGVVLANPNAPTSLALSMKEIEEIVKNNRDNVVVIDEAYVDFGGESAVPLVKKYNNILIVRTLSKSYSLAGIRIGFAIGNEQLIRGMNRVKNSFNSYPIDAIAQVVAKEAIEDDEYFEETRNKIISTRNKTREKLIELGFEVPESKANFLFIKHNKVNAKQIFEYLKNNKILVRYFEKPRIDKYLRVTIGTDKEMDSFIECIKKIIK